MNLEKNKEVKMGSIVLKILALAKFIPSLKKYLDIVFMQAPLSKKLLEIIKNVGKSDDLKEAVFRITGNEALITNAEVEFSQALKAVVSDKINARDRDIAIRRIKNGNNFRANLLLFVAISGLSGCILSLIFLKNILSAEIIAIISTICGVLGSCLKEAYAFEFGSDLNRKHIKFSSFNWPYYIIFFGVLAFLNFFWFCSFK